MKFWNYAVVIILAIVSVATVVAAQDLREQVAETYETVVRIDEALDGVRVDMDIILSDWDEIERLIGEIDRKVDKRREE